MKIFIGMIAYNEEWIIEASLRSVYDYVDKIIIINGGPHGPSTDNTVKIAKSVGPKVKIVDGTFKDTKNYMFKKFQRQAYIDEMEKGENNWCILHDADELYRREDLERLVKYLKNADPKTMLFTPLVKQFFRDFQHMIFGGEWHWSRTIGAFRLAKGVRQGLHNEIFIGKTLLNKTKPPIHMTIRDVGYYHYGHTASFEKATKKRKDYFHQSHHQGKHVRIMRKVEGNRIVRVFAADGSLQSYKTDEWERYYKECWLPCWNLGIKWDHIKPYNGVHPETEKLIKVDD